MRSRLRVYVCVCVCVCVCDTLLATTFSQGFEVGSVSYLSRVFATLSRWSLLFLVPISLIFMGGRGLEAIS